MNNKSEQEREREKHCSIKREKKKKQKEEKGEVLISELKIYQLPKLNLFTVLTYRTIVLRGQRK